VPETAARDKRKKESREHIRIEPAIRHALDDFKTNWKDYAARCVGSKTSQADDKDRRSSRNRGQPRTEDAR